jgi:hypothetical protein
VLVTVAESFTTNNGSSTLTGQQADAVSWYGAGGWDSMSNYQCELPSVRQQHTRDRVLTAPPGQGCP